MVGFLQILQPKQQSIKQNNKGSCHIIKCDVSKEPHVRKLFSLIQKKYGRLDLLFNNAGIGIEANSLDKIKFKDWKKVIDTNINGTINLLEACRQNNVNRFVYASSSSVYGLNKKVPFSQKQAKLLYH